MEVSLTLRKSMDIGEIRASINESGLSLNSRAAIERILDSDAARDGLTDDDKKKILTIIDNEIRFANERADALVADVTQLEQAASVISVALDVTLRDIEMATHELQEELDKQEKQKAQ